MRRGTDRLGYIQALPRTALGTTGPFIFYERGGAGGIGGGGHSKKIDLKGGASRKKMKKRGGGRTKKLD